MNFVLHQVVSSFQKLSSKDDNGSGTITDLSVLDLGQLHEHFSGGVSYFELFQDSGAIIGNCYITNIIDEHLIKTLRSE